MNNQHEKIKAYRDLTQDEIDAMNFLKEKEREILAYLTKLDIGANSPNKPGNISLHRVWFYSGRKDLQLAFMQLNRSIVKPNGEET